MPSIRAEKSESETSQTDDTTASNSSGQLRGRQMVVLEKLLKDSPEINERSTSKILGCTAMIFTTMSCTAGVIWLVDSLGHQMRTGEGCDTPCEPPRGGMVVTLSTGPVVLLMIAAWAICFGFERRFERSPNPVISSKF